MVVPRLFPLRSVPPALDGEDENLPHHRPVPLLLYQRLSVRELPGPQNPARLLVQAGQIIGKLLLPRGDPLVEEGLRRLLPRLLPLEELGEESPLVLCR